MRRIISTAAALILAGSTVFASPTVTNKDASQNIINISGEAPMGDMVSILVLNDGFDLGDAYDDSLNAQQYTRMTHATESGYSFDVKINVPSNGGGIYTAFINVGGKVEKVNFSFYPVEAKNEIINLIKSAKAPSELTTVSQGSTQTIIERAINIYSMNTFLLTDDIDDDSFATILINEFKNGFENVDDASDTMKASICVAALNNSASDAFENGYFAFPELFGLENSNLYKDYASCINKTGLEKICTSLCSKNFKTIDDMLVEFENNVVLQLVVNNAKNGSGHVADILEKYDEVLEDSGFKLSRLSNIKKKVGLYNALVASKASTLSDLAKTFNNYDESDNSSDKGGSPYGSGNSKLNSSSSDVPYYVPETVVPDAQTRFADVSTTHWAKEAIDALLAKGVVNGKGNNNFDPEGLVTRAEFTKMIMGAAKLVDENAQCTFCDVTADWSKPYIASAAKLGIVTGINESEFAPGSNISRQQAAVIVYRTLLTLGINLDGEAIVFEDENTVADYAKEAIAKLSGAKIINGKGNNCFAPLDSLTRAEASKIIYTALVNTFKAE